MAVSRIRQHAPAAMVRGAFGQNPCCISDLVRGSRMLSSACDCGSRRLAVSERYLSLLGLMRLASDQKGGHAHWMPAREPRVAASGSSCRCAELQANVCLRTRIAVFSPRLLRRMSVLRCACDVRRWQVDPERVLIWLSAPFLVSKHNTRAEAAHDIKYTHYDPVLRCLDR